MLTGGCYCGAIRYQASGPTGSHSMCHCAQCRGTTGAPGVAWFTVPRASFSFLSGTPTRFRSSDHATRSFCPACGTQLTFADDAQPGEIDVTTCSLDQPSQLPPQKEIFIASKVEWMPVNPALPQFQRGSVPE